MRRLSLLACLCLALACSPSAPPGPAGALPSAPQPLPVQGERAEVLHYTRSVNDILARHQALDEETEQVLSLAAHRPQESARRLRELAAGEDRLYRELTQIDPPFALEAAHSSWLRALLRYAQAFDAAASYYETGEESRREQANGYFREGLELLAEGYDSLLRVLAAQGIEASEVGSLVVLSREPADLASQAEAGQGTATPSRPLAPTATAPPFSVLKPIPTPLPPLEGALDRANGATLEVRVQRDDGTWVKGTGSVVSTDGLTFLTAFHVIGDLAAGTLFDEEVLVGPQEGPSQKARVLAVDTSLDLAVLRLLVDQSPFGWLPTADSELLQLGETLYTLSYPASGHGSLLVTGGVMIGRYRVRGFAVPLLATDAQVSLGSSGGVVLNRAGELVGVITSRNTSSQDLAAIGYPELEALTLFVPINAARPLLDAAGLP